MNVVSVVIKVPITYQINGQCISGDFEIFEKPNWLVIFPPTGRAHTVNPFATLEPVEPLA